MIYICDHIIYPHSKPKCRNSTLAQKKHAVGSSGAPNDNQDTFTNDAIEESVRIDNLSTKTIQDISRGCNLNILNHFSGFAETIYDYPIRVFSIAMEIGP
jgi:hypothetical protein